MIIAAPIDVQENERFVVLIGSAEYNMYIAAQKAANNFHYSADNKDGEYLIGGSNVKLLRQRGLSGTERMFAGDGANFILGADVEDEENIIDIWWSKDDDKVYFRTKAKSGVTIANSDEIVEFTVSA